MKNIRSILTAALSLMLLLSTTASNGITFSSIATALKGISFTGAQEQVANAGQIAVDAVKAHPYISATAVIAPVVGYGLYKAGKYAFGKKTADKATDLDYNTAITKKIIAKIEKAAQELLIENIQTQVPKLWKTVKAIHKENVKQFKKVDEVQASKIIADLELFKYSIEELPTSKCKIALKNFGVAILRYIKTNDIEPVINAVAVLKTITTDDLDPAQPTVPTVMQRAYALLSSKRTALIGAAIAVPTIAAAGSYYAYKNGYFNGANGIINRGLNFIGLGEKPLRLVKKFAANVANEVID